MDFKEALTDTNIWAAFRGTGLELEMRACHIESFSTQKSWGKVKDSRNSGKLISSSTIYRVDGAIVDLNGWTTLSKVCLLKQQSLLSLHSRYIVECQILKKWNSGIIPRIQFYSLWLFIVFIPNHYDLLCSTFLSVLSLLRYSYNYASVRF
jgi:hypothetical protein